MKMRRWKRTLSAVLAGAMMLTAMSGGISAFAEEVGGTSDTVAAATEAITAVNNDNTNIAADATEANQAAYDAKLKLYNDAVTAYKTVPEKDRDELDAAMMVKFLGNYINREAYVDVREKNPDADRVSIAITDRKAVMDGLAADLGDHPERDAAMAFAAEYYAEDATIGGVYVARYSGTYGNQDAIRAMNATTRGQLKTALEDALDSLKAFTQDELIYLGAIGSTMTNMDYFSTSSNYMYLANILKNYRDVLVIEDPWDGTVAEREPQPPENTARYEDAYRAYMDEKKAYRMANEEKSAYELEVAAQVLGSFTAGAAFSEAVNMALDMYESFMALVDDVTDLTVIRETKTAYDTFYARANTDFQKSVYNQVRNVFPSYVLGYMNMTPDWAFASVGATQWPTYMQNAIDSEAAYDEFVEALNALNVDEVTNDDIAEIRAQYNALPNVYKQCASDDVYDKLYDVLAAYTPEHPANVPSDDQFEDVVGSWEQTEVAYPDYETATPENIQTYIIDALDSTLPSLLGQFIPEIGAAGSLQAYLEQTVYTNQALATILNLYHTLAGLNITIDAGGMQLNIGEIIEGIVKPSELSELLTEEKFSGAKAKIDAAGTANEDDSVAYVDIAFANGDWGFQDGDQEGFINAFAAVLRPLINALTLDGAVIGIQLLYMPNTVEVDGNYTYGAYEYLIPLLEGIGLEGVISSEEYSDAFFAAETKGEKLDAAILPILKPIFGLVDDIAAFPFNTLLDLLPRLGKVVNDGILNDSVKNALGTSSVLSGLTASLDLSADGLNSLISSLIPTLLGEDTEFVLEAIDWNALAYSGTPDVVESVSSTNMYRVDVVSDKPATFIMVANYLFDNLIGNETNWNEIVKLLGGIEGIEAYLPMIESLVKDTIRPMGVDGLLIMFLPDPKPVDPTDPTEPTDPSEPTEPSEPTTGDDMQAPDTTAPTGGDNTPGGDSNVETGDAALAAVAGVALLAAGAVIVLAKKRK